MRPLPVIIAFLLLGLSFFIPGGAGAPEKPTEVIYDLEFPEGLVVGIGEDLIWENLTVSITGWSYIYGNLRLRNTTIHFFGDINNSSRLQMRNWGTFNATDLDGDPTTMDDMSRIISYSQNGTSIIPGHIALSYSINNSYIENVRIISGIMDLRDLEMRNSSILSPTMNSIIRDIRMKGNSNLTGIIFNEFYEKELYNITIDGYGTGIDHGQGSGNSTVQLREVQIRNCKKGILAPESGFRIRECTFVNNTEPISTGGDIFISDSTFRGGKLTLSRSGGSLIQRSEFVGLESLRNASNGKITDSTFRFCNIGLRSPTGMDIIRNSFLNCSTAVRDDSGCRLFHNSFGGNQRDAQGAVLSQWYNTTLLEGNYYLEYKGVDDGSGGRRALDGIGDTYIPYNGRDSYPLMKDRYWDMPVIPTLQLLYQKGSDAVTLVWDQTGFAGCIVQRSLRSDFSGSLSSWSVKDTAIRIPDNPNGTVHFRVMGYNSFGARGWSVPRSLPVDRKPLPPSEIRIDPVPRGQGLTISWDWVGEDVVRAFIFYGLPDEAPELAEADHPMNSVTVTGLVNGVEYEIWIQTLDSAGQFSGESQRVRGIPEDSVPPPPPRDLTASAVTNRKVVLNWNPPLEQDIGSYLLFRRLAGEMEWTLVKNLSRYTFTFDDGNLEDNTTYQYAMATVDDDGPISVLSHPVNATTLHYNDRPYFTGGEQIIYLVEDGPAVSMDLTGRFQDPDGDAVQLSIRESFPFQANLIGEVLWITPRPDEAGEGYVQLTASDGEEEVDFLFGVIIEPREDLPRGLLIESPVNGSVLLPGMAVRLRGEVYDPDVNHGDSLNITWTSDRDGILQHSSQGKINGLVELSPGPHLLTLSVVDRAGNMVQATSMVIVSLWGWGELPWDVSIGETSVLRKGELYGVEVKVTNDSPFVLRYYIKGTVGSGSNLPERMILIGPGTSERLMLELPQDLETGIELPILLMVEADTINGTYGGYMETDSTITIRPEGSDGGDSEWVVAVVVISIAVLLAIAVYIFVTTKRREALENPKDD
ncbi:MAG: fibronectin type III domain-containing protein [Thermoplasmatota archaeon]